MRILSVSHTFFFFAFYCICLLSSSNCEEQLVQDGNGEHLNPNLGSLLVHGPITLENEPVADGDSDSLRAILLKNLEKKLAEETNQQDNGSLSDKNAISNDKNPLAMLISLYADPKENGQLSLRKLNRRSAEEAQNEKEEQSTHDSGFSSGKRGEDQHSGERQADTSKGENEKETKNYDDNSDNHHGLNLPFKNNPLEIVTQPIKNVLNFLLDRIKRHA